MATDFITVTEASERSGMSEFAIYRRIQRDACPFAFERVGRAVLVNRMSFEEWLTSRDSEATA